MIKLPAENQLGRPRKTKVKPPTHPLMKQFVTLLQNSNPREAFAKAGYHRDSYYRYMSYGNVPRLDIFSDVLEQLGYELKIVKRI